MLLREIVSFWRVFISTTVIAGVPVDVDQAGGWLVVLVLWTAHQWQHWLCISLEMLSMMGSIHN